MFSWFKRRDLTLFPADAYGDALYKAMRKDAARSERSIGIDLTFTFASEADARRFIVRIDHASYRPEIEEPDEAGGAWTIETMREIQPRHAPVRVLIEQMRDLAKAHRGDLSAWSLFW